jgi:hypothetical protein
MNPKIIFSGFLMLLVCTFLIAGCQTQAPRLSTYVGEVEGLHASQNPHPQSLPSAINRVGVLIMTDSSFPNSALPLSPDMLAILENRLVKKMDEFFGLEVIPIRPEQQLQPTGDMSPFTHLTKIHKLDFMLLAVLSSTEEESHIEIGEETMMTRMSGVSIDNEALAELALINADSGKIALHAAGNGASSMEQLAVPIGEDYSRKEDARDILRANAAQQALDQALLALQRQWGRSLVTGG